MSDVEIARLQAEARAFEATEIGRLFCRFERALERACVTDSTSFNGSSMQRDWDVAAAARRNVVTAIKALQTAVTS